MGRRTSRMVKNGLDGMLVAAFSAALILLLTAPAGAQTDATDLASETARITDSADTDPTVDRIVVTVADCEADNNASVVVRDDDGTQARLSNVTVTTDADAVTIVGTGAGGNLEGINAGGGNGQFGTEGATVEGEIVSARGITCDRDADDDEGGPSQGQYGDDGDNGDDLNCDDFDSRAEAQAEYEEDTDDPNNLDADDDGEACEDFPYGQVIDDGDDEDLPDTGGPPLTLFAGLCLLAALALLARSLTGRGA